MNPTTPILNQIDILADVELVLAKITDAQIVRLGAKMSDPRPNEKALGTVHHDAAKRVYLAAAIFKGIRAKTTVDWQNADNDETEKALHYEMHRADRLNDLCMTLAWCQIRAHVGHWRGNIALRKDWLAVTWEDDPGSEMNKLLLELERLLPGQ